MQSWFDVRIRPMLASLSSEPFDSPAYIYEAKWEGVRCLAFLDQHSHRLQNRHRLDITARFPELAALWQGLKVESAVIDGVLLVLENGRPCADKSLQRESASDSEPIRRLAIESPAVLVAFDILRVNGQSVMERPLRERKDLLSQAITPTPQLVLGSWVSEKGIALLDQVSRAGIRGVVAKAGESPYLPGQRVPFWLKMQRFKLQDCLICGYTEGQGRREALLGSLVLGVYYGGQLVHIGQVGSGYNHETLRELHALASQRITGRSPFAVEPQIDRHVTWIEPDLICEVQYSEWTADCKLRSPRFIRLRENKRQEDCEMEEVCYWGGAQIELEPIGARLLG